MKNPGPFFKRLPLLTRILSAYLSITLENLLTVFGPLLLWLGAFSCLWLLGISFLLLTIFFWIGAVFFALKGLDGINLPKRLDAYRRLEKESGLLHRPLQSLDDQKSAGGSDDFWHFEKQRQKRLLASLRYAKPAFDLAKKDPYSVRIALILIFICGFFVSRDFAWQRLSDGMFSFAPISEKTSLPLGQIKIIPPAYTGMQAIVLNQPKEDSIPVTQGSRIRAELRKGTEIFDKAPILEIGDLRKSFSETENQWRAEALIPQARQIRIKTLGFSRFKQAIDFKEDTPPSIAWKDAPVTLPNGEMRLPLNIKDDFGIEKIILRGILPPAASRPRYGLDIKEEKIVSIPIREGDITIAPVFDLTGHPWAGRAISLMIEVHDYAGNVAYTAPVDFTLPTRQFRNSTALRLAESRSRLLKGESGPREEIMPIGEILLNPGLYAWDPIVTLALRSVIGRLLYNENDIDIESAAASLWQTALRLETGRAGETRKNLAETIEKLQQALLNDDKDRATQLMQQVLQSLASHLNALGRQMQQSDGTQINTQIDLKSLSDFIQQLEQAIRNGDMATAMDKLSQLQQLSETMQAASQGLPQDIQKRLKDLENLQAILKRQQDLLDSTRSEKNPDASEQKSIQKDTAAIKAKISNPSKKLGNAETEMRLSADALEKDNARSSIPHQEEALKNLRDSGKEMRQDLQKRLQNMLSLSGSPSQSDPLGRQNGPLRDDGIEIPDQDRRKKVDDVIKILRERSGDMSRPKEERDYYQRLLKQW